MVLPLLAILAATSLSGCGTGTPSDRDQITTIVTDEGANPSSLCAHLVDTLLQRFGGKSACLRQAASAAKDPSTHATSVKIQGSNATAVVSDRAGTRTLTLVKQQNSWKISGVR
jgi:hypothetical protein